MSFGYENGLDDSRSYGFVQYRSQGFVQDGFEESAAFGLGGGELRFQPVAQGHQFLNFGDDAFLFCESSKNG